ncbi:MAG: glycosyltransferase family 39 protein [Deltaproteobacteria bacterium]|nr:glycosyltransferase family 39 protein [Deltaproteobacteria bacterium]
MNSKWKRELLLILVVSAPFIFWGMGSISFLDPDEGMWGSIAREMAEGGNWITPHFNGVRYLEKPPLHYWLSALTISAFGPSEWAVRLWSAVPALGTALLIWRMGGWLYGKDGGLLSAIIFATSIGVFHYARIAFTEFLLIFSITLAMFGFIKATLSGERLMANDQRSWINAQSSGVLIFYVGLALGVLSKGLIGLVFPFLIVGIFLLFANGKWQMVNGGERRLFTVCYSLFTSRYSLIGLLLFLLLTLPWHLLVAWQNPGFFDFYVVDNQLLRFLNRRAFLEDDIPLTTPVFLLVTWIWFFPSSLFLPIALRQGFPRFRPHLPLNEGLRLIVGLWALMVIGFFSLSFSKLEHYSLAALPALSLMVGGCWADAFSSCKSSPNVQSPIVSNQGVGFKWCLGIAAIGTFLFGAGLVLFSDFLSPKALFAMLSHLNGYYRSVQAQGFEFPFSPTPFISLLKWLGLTLLVGVPAAFFLFRLKRARSGFYVLVGMAAGILIFVIRVVLLVESHHSSKPVAHALLAQSQASDLIIHEGALEYSAGLPFYMGRQIYVLNGKRGDLEFGSRYPETQHLFLDDEDFSRLWKGHRRVFLVTRLQEEENALKRLLVENPHFMGRYGSRWLYSNHGP